MKSKRKFVSFITAFAMALLLCASFGVCSGFTANAEEANPLAEMESYTVQAKIQPRALDIPNGYTPSRQYTREATFYITDAGAMRNSYDVVPIYAYSDYTEGELVDADFTTMTVRLHLEFWQIDRGYQWFYLYRDETAGTMIRDINFECEYSDVPVWHTVEFKDLRMKDFDKNLIVRYDASGKNDDDWCNRNLTVEITFYKG